MLFVRETFFRPGQSPMTAVFPEDALKEEIHVHANGTRMKFGRAVDVEIFEWENDLVSATAEAGRRALYRIPDEDHFQKTLHDFLVSMFVTVPPTTVVMTTRPAPLSTDLVKAVALAAMGNKAYKNHIAKLISSSGDTVVLGNGQISVRDA